MAGRVAVVGVLTLIIVPALGRASASYCYTKPDKEVTDREEKVHQQNVIQQQTVTKELHMKPGSEFEAVCVQVRDKTLDHDPKHCFELDNCNLTDTKWNRLVVEAKVVKPFSNTVQFNLAVDDCGEPKLETESYAADYISQLRVFAKGTSKWLVTTPPNTCPGQGGSSLSSGTILILVVVVVLVVVAVAMAVSLVIRKRQHRSTSPQTIVKCSQSPGQGEGRRGSLCVTNSLYGVLPGPVNPAATDQEKKTVQVVENNLYETLPDPVNSPATDQQEKTMQVVENNLYECLPDPANPAATDQQEKTVQVVGNNLYECLPDPVNPPATNMCL